MIHTLFDLIEILTDRFQMKHESCLSYLSMRENSRDMETSWAFNVHEVTVGGLY